MVLNERQSRFRDAIFAFIEERRQAKLKGAEVEEEGGSANKYDYHTWLADAARRVSQIQAVTHVLKATHPDARGSSLYCLPEQLPQQAEVGSHNLAANFAEDIVGNAAALDVYKFLKIEVEGLRLLDWMQKDDDDLVAALHPERATAQAWMDAFKSLVRPVEQYQSHVLAKQIYWCAGLDPTEDANFHLLQPLFPSSLVHYVYHNISEVRFGETNTQARQAFHKKSESDLEYREYRNLAARKLGGTKPQNISQLNSERGGVNYLFGSLPPIARYEKKVRPIWKSWLAAFSKYENVSLLMKQFAEFLKQNPHRNMEIKIRAEEFERQLGQALAAFGCETRAALNAGWTRDPKCELSMEEKVWLDLDRAELEIHPDYAEDDTKFREIKEWKDWPDVIATQFAQWVNEKLTQAGLPVGDTELKHWASKAIVDAEWPATFKRHATKKQEVNYG